MYLQKNSNKALLKKHFHFKVLFLMKKTLWWLLVSQANNIRSNYAPVTHIYHYLMLIPTYSTSCNTHDHICPQYI